VSGRRTGFTLVEALVALLLGSLLAALSVGTFARQRTLQATLAHRAEALGTLRIVRSLLDRELRGGDGTEEVGEDTLALRAYRGTGVVCGASADARELVVRVEGVRAPDPDKDSVLVRGAGGGERIAALLDRVAEPGGCPGGRAGTVERWRLSEVPPPAPLLARWFERGTYHLQGAALRYRSGAGGRQPLTPETLLTPPSRFFLLRPGARAAELFLAGDSAGVPSLVAPLGRPAGAPGA